MKIIETGLQFYGLRSRKSTSLIVLHHSASPDVPAAEIHSWHLARGWAGIGYHFIIRSNGSIEKGRPLETIGAHAGSGVNGCSIGICLCGDFMKAAPSAVQISSLIELITWLEKYYSSSVPTGLDIKLHWEVAATECPGILFPWDQISKSLQRPAGSNEGVNTVDDWKLKIMAEAREAGLIRGEHQPDEPAPKWFVLAVALHTLDIIRNGGN